MPGPRFMGLDERMINDQEAAQPEIAMIVQLFFNGILQGSTYALVSLGLTLIFGVMKIINFAHGEFLMLSMYCTFWMFQLYGVDPYLSIVVVVPVMFLAGMVTYRLIIQPIIDAPEVAHVFATLGLNIALQGLAIFFWRADFRAVPTSSYIPQSIHFGSWYMNGSRLAGSYSS
jgi:branched-chain amino acid transport system permease protein